MRLTFRYRLYPTSAQRDALDGQLRICCELYNAALQERRDAWRMARVSIGFTRQSAQLPAIRIDRPDVAAVYAQVLQDVLRRVDRSFNGFFGRVRRGERAGFPRFRAVRRFDSLTYPQYPHKGFAVTGRHLTVSRIGAIKIKLHRPIAGTIKTLTIKREAGKWFACFSVVVEPVPLPALDADTGIDVGLTSFAMMADGTAIENPQYYRQAQARLRRAQRKVSRRKQGSHRRRKAIALLQRAYRHVRNQRADFHHKAARTVVNTHGMIGVEDLNLSGLLRGRLAKSVHDAGWAQFLTFVRYKAANAGRCVIQVDPRGTSQTCVCGAPVPKTLAVRWHHCPACGLSLPRDHVSAQLILLMARTAGLRSGIWPRPDQPSNANVETCLMRSLRSRIAFRRRRVTTRCDG